jgi:hypothetical protein
VALRPLTVLLAVLAGIGGALAFFTSSNPALAVPFAGLGVAAAAGAADLVLAGGARIRPQLPPPRLADFPVELLDAFYSGKLGRVGVIAALRRLNRAFDATHEFLSMTEEERLLAAPTPEFLGWVDGELTRLERAT